MVRPNLAPAGFDRLTDSGGDLEAPLAEHAMVRLAVQQDLDDGRRLPLGARGAVVFVHGKGAAYEVEFVTPFHAIATVEAADLSRDAAA